MTSFQKTVKNLAIVFAIYLTISIIGGIFSAVGVLSGLSRGDAATEDLKKYDLSSDVQSLDVEINAADFTIRHGEGFSVESNLKDLTVKTQNGVLQIKQTKRSPSSVKRLAKRSAPNARKPFVFNTAVA